MIILRNWTPRIKKFSTPPQKKSPAIRYIPYCPAVTTPLFATYFQEIEGRGRNNKDLHFHLAVKPPPTNSRTEINEVLL